MLRPVNGRSAVLAVVLLGATAGCNGTLPEDGQTAAINSKLDFAVTPMAGGSAIDVTWQSRTAGYPHLTSYHVGLGAESRSGDFLGGVDVPASQTSYRFTDVPPGLYYAHVEAYEGSNEVAASEVKRVQSIDGRLMIDALLFAEGTLADAANSGRNIRGQGRVLGWGAERFDVLVGASAPEPFVTALQQEVAKIRTATRGRLAPVVQARPAPLPDPGYGEVAVIVVSSDADTPGWCRAGFECVRVSYPRGSVAADRASVVVFARSTPPDNAAAAAHALGHVIGLSHVLVPDHGYGYFLPAFAMATGGFGGLGREPIGFDPGALWLLGKMYDTGLTAGSSRSDYVAAGLVPADPGSSARRSAQEASPEEVTVLQDGGATVLRYVCRR